MINRVVKEQIAIKKQRLYESEQSNEWKMAIKVQYMIL